jgi:hypothetical protein
VHYAQVSREHIQLHLAAGRALAEVVERRQHRAVDALLRRHALAPVVLPGGALEETGGGQRDTLYIGLQSVIV